MCHTSPAITGGAAAKKRTYDLNTQSDAFFSLYAGEPFPEAVEAPTLTGPFRLVSYMPRFGQQAYFVSFPSRFLGPGKDAVMAFSANFACRTGGCEPNIQGAGYGANLLPVRLEAGAA